MRLRDDGGGGQISDKEAWKLAVSRGSLYRRTWMKRDRSIVGDTVPSRHCHDVRMEVRLAEPDAINRRCFPF